MRPHRFDHSQLLDALVSRSFLPVGKALVETRRLQTVVTYELNVLGENLDQRFVKQPCNRNGLEGTVYDENIVKGTTLQFFYEFRRFGCLW